MSEHVFTSNTYCRLRKQPAQALADVCGKGPWLVIAPHDDDTPLGMGGTIAAATAEHIAVHVCTLSDGSMGWWDPSEAADLITIRSDECQQALLALGVPLTHQHQLNLPDGRLQQYQGCRPDNDGPSLGRLLVRLMRRIRPQSVWVCTEADLHPDHRLAAHEVSMACCWASSAIWHELGKPIQAPLLWHYAVYCAFPQPPTLQIALSESCFQDKMSSLRRFNSQPFISDMISRLEADGPYEYFQQAQWKPYRPADYHQLFQQ